MSSDDRIRWDKRYREGPFALLKTPRTFLVENQALLPASGLALDVAMGLGGNAAFLQAHGLRVVGVDVSSVAVRTAKADHPELQVFIADLNRVVFPSAYFDVIVNMYYLNRELWREYPRMLKPGGLLVLETLSQGMRQIKPELEPERLLNDGELNDFFPSLEIISAREGWFGTRAGDRKAIGSLVARKPY